MSNLNKVTQQRIDDLTNALMYELAGFQIDRKEIKITMVGTVDLPLFRIRFRFLTPEDLRDDDGYEVILLSHVDEIKFDSIFWPMVRKGYLHYLRKRIPNMAFINFLERKDLWRSLLEAVMEETRYTNPYKYACCKRLYKQPIWEILSENKAAFDWLV
jgi:hypothetical protein